jgi:hypothetical protein
MILYRQPGAPATFEDYYANRHIPHTSKHMVHVRMAENMRAISTDDGPGVLLSRVEAEP